MKKKLVKLFEISVSIGITAGFLYLFYAVIGFEKFAQFFRQINPVNVIVAFFLYFLSYITRTLRWKLTLSIKDFRKLFRITAFNTVFNIFLPFRTGELSFFYMLKKENIPFSESAITFFTVRIFDAISLFSVFGAALLFLKGFYLYAFLLIIVMPISAVILKHLSSVINYKKLEEFKKSKLSLRNITVLYGLSVLTFFLKFSSFYLVLPAGIDLGFVRAFFAASAGDVTTILPIHGIAGIGTYEGGYAGVLILLGIDKERALLASVFVHIFMLTGAAVIAALAYLLKPIYFQKPD
ncbi:flippase-like domain-containing protein [Persephonella atlantica]|uniref:Flippase-like domain-containing protein n=1 Tax=Persephonella atlantica TaxID=2699429 RepID=A0ABS1GF80_9AQUI|nr:lysylphosphatidylglycerol synthase transmembrane domain-containing protein [Persephonella atlantica]MBK3331579.1 flippase-like domain-containing protein [Persephonella atlantica]